MVKTPAPKTERFQSGFTTCHLWYLYAISVIRCEGIFSGCCGWGGPPARQGFYAGSKKPNVLWNFYTPGSTRDPSSASVFTGRPL